MQRTPQRDRLALLLLLWLIPLAAWGAVLVRISNRWTAVPQPLPGPTATPLPDRGRWREWERGLATWYEGPTEIMRNGERFDPAGLTCAVDASAWAELKGKMVRVRLQGKSDEGVILRVTDTGYLKDAGRFVWDPLRRMYMPSPLAGLGQYVVIDIPRDTHKRLYQGHTVAVIVEVEE